MNDEDQKVLADAITRLADRLVIAKDAELAHLRDLNSTLTGISTYLNQLIDVQRELLERSSK